eukprot:scaffold1276_cov162-Amphora_coffeaeformis.AAC.14
MDAVQDVKELDDEDRKIALLLTRQGSNATDRFFDAESGSVDGETSSSMNEPRTKASNRTATTAASSTTAFPSSRQDATNDDNKEDEFSNDEALLAPEYRTDGSTSTYRRRKRHHNTPDEMGFPGFLKPDQLQAYRQLRDELRRHPPDSIYHQMVYNYIDLEPESYALCRYLRLYYFHVKKVFHHMDHHAARWKQAATRDFYPNVQDAVGAPLSVLLTQFPSLYYGLSKQGYPCCYFSAGTLSVEGIECVTEPDNLANVIWHNMMHDMKYNKFPEAKKRHPDFKRYVEKDGR